MITLAFAVRRRKWHVLLFYANAHSRQYESPAVIRIFLTTGLRCRFEGTRKRLNGTLFPKPQG